VDSSARSQAAQALLEAYRTGVPIAPLTSTYTGMEISDAYAIQIEQVADFTGRGERIKGHKVGLTSAAMQQQLGVDQPDFGHLWTSMFHLENLPIPAGSYLAPRIEPEVAFVLRRELRGPGVTVAEAIAATDFVLPALEIIDSRIKDWKITLLDTIADNASSGGVVLGSRPTRLEATDLRLTGCLLHRNGEVVATGAGGAVLGSPISAVVWLANTVGALGTTLEAGEVILSGSMTAAVPVAPGDVFTASLGPLGSVTARFAAETEES
jgi:2-keto-4-pentenoate hydratase